MKSLAQRLKELPELKLRASSGGDLANPLTGITEKQAAELKDLLAKPSPTLLQMGKIAELTHKRDNPELTAGAATFVEKWLWENLRQKRVELKNKYVVKGILVEDESIAIAERYHGWGFAMKNEQHFEDDFFTGTPDLFVEDDGIKTVTDIKSSWDENTFKFFDEAYQKEYEYQLQVYMHLTGIRRALLERVLTNTPIHLIEAEAYSYCRSYGYDPGKDIRDSEIFADLYDKMTFDDLPDELRVKRWEFYYDFNVIEKMQKGVIEGRNYKDVLINKYIKPFIK